MPYKLMLALLATMSLLIPGSLHALAQDEEPPAEEAPAQASEAEEKDAIIELLDELVTSITDQGITPFEGIAYPFVVLKGGDDPGMAVFEGPADLGGGGDAVMILSDAEIELMGRVAVAEFVFGLADEPRARAKAFAVFAKPLGFWVVQALGLAPAVPLEGSEDESELTDMPSDRDAVAGLMIAFVDSLTTTGPREFAGLEAPFIYMDGASGQLLAYAESLDFPVPGDPLELRATEIESTVLPGLALTSARVLGPDEFADFRILSIRGPGRWQIMMACVAPGQSLELLGEAPHGGGAEADDDGE